MTSDRLVQALEEIAAKDCTGYGRSALGNVARKALEEYRSQSPAEGDADALAKALEAVCLSASSLNSGPANALTVGGERVYWQREEWVRWMLDEVLPDARKALNAHTMRAASRAQPKGTSEYAEVDDKLLTGQAQYLISALMNHGLLPGKALPEDKYLKLWDVVKAQLRAVHREAVRAAQAPAPAPTGELPHERVLRWAEQHHVRFVSRSYGQQSTDTISFAALEALAAQAPAVKAEPLSQERVTRMLLELNAAATADSPSEMFTIIVRAVEQAHGIGEAQPPVQGSQS